MCKIRRNNKNHSSPVKCESWKDNRIDNNKYIKLNITINTIHLREHIRNAALKPQYEYKSIKWVIINYSQSPRCILGISDFPWDPHFYESLRPETWSACVFKLRSVTVLNLLEKLFLLFYARRRVLDGAPLCQAAVQSNGSCGGEYGLHPLLGGVYHGYKYTLSVATPPLEPQWDKLLPS